MIYMSVYVCDSLCVIYMSVYVCDSLCVIYMSVYVYCLTVTVHCVGTVLINQKYLHLCDSLCV